MKISNLLAITIAGLFLISCGGDNKKNEESTPKVTVGSSSTSENSAVNEKESTDGVIKLSLEGNDEMKFNKKRLRAKAGAEVELTFKHVGEMSKQAMGHNFVLLKLGVNPMEFGQKAASAMDNDYIPKDTEDVIVHTEMLGGGEETVLKFTAPTEKGEYDFICSFPGHVALMKGKFIVD